MNTTLSAIGLAINMIGAVFAFIVGFPQPEFTGADHALHLESAPSEEELSDARRRRRRWSSIGPTLMFIGRCCTWRTHRVSKWRVGST